MFFLPRVHSVDDPVGNNDTIKDLAILTNTPYWLNDFVDERLYPFCKNSEMTFLRNIAQANGPKILGLQGVLVYGD